MADSRTTPILVDTEERPRINLHERANSRKTLDSSSSGGQDNTGLASWYFKEVQDLRTTLQNEQFQHQRDVDDVTRRYDISLEIARREFAELEGKYNHFIPLLEEEIIFLKKQLMELIRELRIRRFKSNQILQIVAELEKRLEAVQEEPPECLSPRENHQLLKSGSTQLPTTPRNAITNTLNELFATERYKKNDSIVKLEEKKIPFGLMDERTKLPEFHEELEAFMKQNDEFTLSLSSINLEVAKTVSINMISPHQVPKLPSDVHHYSHKRTSSKFSSTFIDTTSEDSPYPFSNTDYDDPIQTISPIPRRSAFTRKEISQSFITRGAYTVTCRICGDSIAVEEFTKHLLDCCALNDPPYSNKSTEIIRQFYFKFMKPIHMHPLSVHLMSEKCHVEHCELILKQENEIIDRLTISVCEDSNDQTIPGHIHCIIFQYGYATDTKNCVKLRRNTQAIRTFHESLIAELPNLASSYIYRPYKDSSHKKPSIRLKSFIQLEDYSEPRSCRTLQNYIRTLFYVRTIRRSSLVRRFFKIPTHWEL